MNADGLFSARGDLVLCCSARKGRWLRHRWGPSLLDSSANLLLFFYVLNESQAEAASPAQAGEVRFQA